MKLKNILATLLFAAMPISMMAEGVTVSVSPQPLKISPEGTEVSFDMNNGSFAVWQAEVHIILPEGVSVVLDEGDPDISLIRNDSKNKHVLEANVVNNEVIIVISTTSEKTIAGTEGTLFTINLKAGDTFTTGDIQFTNMVFVPLEETTPSEKPADITVTAENSTTGISVIEAEKALNGEAYTIGGVKADETTKGIIIQNGKKVIK